MAKGEAGFRLVRFGMSVPSEEQVERRKLRLEAVFPDFLGEALQCCLSCARLLVKVEAFSKSRSSWVCMALNLSWNENYVDVKQNHSKSVLA